MSKTGYVEDVRKRISFVSISGHYNLAYKIINYKNKKLRE